MYTHKHVDTCTHACVTPTQPLEEIIWISNSNTLQTSGERLQFSLHCFLLRWQWGLVLLSMGTVKNQVISICGCYSFSDHRNSWVQRLNSQLSHFLRNPLWYIKRNRFTHMPAQRSPNFLYHLLPKWWGCKVRGTQVPMTAWPCHSTWLLSLISEPSPSRAIE